MTQEPHPDRLGVIIVTFDSAPVIVPCLDSLAASRGVALTIVVVDNCSNDDTCERVRSWAAEHTRTDPAFRFRETNEGPDTPAPAADRDQERAGTSTLTLVHASFNGGYGRGVNTGLKVLLDDAGLDLFWILNPDCVVEENTAALYHAAGADGAFALMSCRTVSCDEPDMIQSDGGRISGLTGVCRSVNSRCDRETTPLPDAASLDFVTGSNMVASRAFVAAAGLMEESFFLYYEEVEWAMRRDALPLRLVKNAHVGHHGGTAIGSGTAGRTASAFSLFFNFRSRMRFLRRHRPAGYLGGIAHALAKAAQLRLGGQGPEAAAVLAGAFGRPPPAAIAARIAPGAARRLAFGKE